MKTVLLIKNFILIMITFLLLSFNAKANDITPLVKNSGYVANNESIKGVFDVISSKINIPIILSNLAARNKITSEVEMLEP